MASRRRQRSQSGGSLLSKDPFGLVWLSIIFLAVMIVKWWVLSPANAEEGNCVACVVAVIWLLAIATHLLLVFFWMGWSKKYEKGTAFVFFLSLLCLFLAAVDFHVVQFAVGKLFYGGVLNWQESQASYLIDIFIPHSVGLLLISSIFYSMLRVFVSRDLAEKKLVYLFASIIMLAAVPLYFLALIAY
jgi:hypothetical protein